MSKFTATPDFRHDAPARTGVLLVNLGTPRASTPSAVRQYLAEFLWDPRLVEMPRPLWWLILHGVILRIRPGRVARAYQSVWRQEGAPLLHFSRELTRACETAGNQGDRGELQFALAMRYGQPSIASALRELRAANVQRLVVIPLYPQYSATTTASVFDAVSDELRNWRELPDLRFITHYHDHPLYIQAIARSIQQARSDSGKADKLLFSFHGLPKRYLLAGDPYYCECQKTARLVAESLQLKDDEYAVAFQSRFGREEWLQPYTDQTLKQWAAQGIRHVQVISPGFSVDCLETLEEMDIQNRENFLEHGGERFEYIPALNAQPDHVRLIMALVEQSLAGFASAPVNAEPERQQRRERAIQLGAAQ
jgi:ferrochelatase